tara:strand:+ start:261 stop:494 length:234 start_codon:yes stop_codon:yes gene_type:complete
MKESDMNILSNCVTVMKEVAKDLYAKACNETDFSISNAIKHDETYKHLETKLVRLDKRKLKTKNDTVLVEVTYCNSH